jgi:hypothetical protein
MALSGPAGRRSFLEWMNEVTIPARNPAAYPHSRVATCYQEDA